MNHQHHCTLMPNNTQRQPSIIIPGVTPCCDGLYAQICSPNKVEIDADCIRDGDTLMCPTCNDVPIFVFGTGWWEANGGTFDTNAEFKAWCPKHGCYIVITTWSYRG
jgi:hypothetical protein